MYKSNKGLKVLVVILILLVLGLTGYLIYDKVISKEEVKPIKVTEKKKEKVESNTDNDVPNSIVSNLILSSDKSINKKDMEYSLSTNNDINGVGITYNDNIVNINISQDIVKNSYNGIAISNSSYNVSFSKKLVDIYVDGFGQTIGYETILFLMEDGSVEYIPFYYACKNNNFQTYKLEGVENIIKFLSVDANPVQPGGGYHAILAQKQDGTFYDISSMLSDTQYYNNF